MSAKTTATLTLTEAVNNTVSDDISALSQIRPQRLQHRLMKMI